MQHAHAEPLGMPRGTLQHGGASRAGGAAQQDEAAGAGTGALGGGREQREGAVAFAERCGHRCLLWWGELLRAVTPMGQRVTPKGYDARMRAVVALGVTRVMRGKRGIPGPESVTRVTMPPSRTVHELAHRCANRS